MRIRSLIPLIFAVLLVVLQVWQNGQPPVRDRDAPAQEFSALRALDHLAQFAIHPRPMGSAESQNLRDYISTYAANLGLTVQRNRGILVEDRVEPVLADLENLIVRLPGSDNTRSVLMMAHYDSVPGAPGAGDDGVGVATLLESMRALCQSAPLRNDILFLFTDGEELGLLGARLFAGDPQRLAGIGVVLNFEGRGNRGPVWLFETSDPNEWIVHQFARASPYPVGNSLSYEIYKRLPNDTDFSVFRRAGLPGFNFAQFGGISHYHTRLDSLSNLDLKSLQQHGSYAVALGRELAGRDLTNIDLGGELVYGNLIGNLVVYYSKSWVIPSLILAWLILLGVIGFQGYRRAIRWTGLLTGFLAFLFLVILCPLGIWGLWRLVARLHPRASSWIYGQPYEPYWWMLALVTAGCLLFLLGMKAGLDRFDRQSFLVGVVTCTLLLTSASSVWIPGVHFLFFWPVLGGIVGLLIRFSAPTGEESFGAALVLGLTILPASYLPAQAGQLHEALTLNLVVAPCAVMIFFLGVLAPHFSSLYQEVRLLELGVVMMLGFLLIAILRGGAAPDRPRVDSLAYALNANDDAARWVSTDSEPDDWTNLFLRNGQTQRLSWLSPLVNRPLLNAPAELFPVAPIEVESAFGPGPEEDEGVSSSTLSLKITPGRLGSYLWFSLTPASRLLSAKVQGKKLEKSSLPDDSWRFRYLAPPESGVEVALEIEGMAPVSIRVIESRRGLPESFQKSHPRPSSTMSRPSPYWLQDSTLVSRELEIP